MNIPELPHKDGRYLEYGPSVDGWVVALRVTTPRSRKPPAPQGEQLWFWHGPDAGGSASHLTPSVAVFPRRADAIEAFESTFSVRFSGRSPNIRWMAMSVAQAERAWKAQLETVGIRQGHFGFGMGRAVHSTEPSPDT